MDPTKADQSLPDLNMQFTEDEQEALNLFKDDHHLLQLQVNDHEWSINDLESRLKALTEAFYLGQLCESPQAHEHVAKKPIDDMESMSEDLKLKALIWGLRAYVGGKKFNPEVAEEDFDAMSMCWFILVAPLED